MKKGILTALLVTSGLAGGCAKEPPAPSVDEYVLDRVLLEAALVRCSQNRAKLKYTAECLNAREASNRIAVEAEAERRKQLEAQSERKRNALRRAQVAAEQARQRAEEAARLRAEAEYLAQFNTGDGADGAESDTSTGAVPAVDAVPPADAATSVPEGEPPPADDLQSIREELERRRRSGETPR